MRATILTCALLLGCAGGEDDTIKGDTATTASTETTATWEEVGDGDGGTTTDKTTTDKTTSTKPSTYPACGDEVVAGEACEGDWYTTTCIDDDGVYWWCEAGVWTSEKD